MPAQKNLEVWKGNTFALPISLKTRTNGVTTPVDLTGSILVFRAEWTGGFLRKSTAIADGFSVLDAVAGSARLTLSVAETRALPVGRIKYEVERQTGADQTTILFGELVVAGWVNDD